jgi:hypothetical protein
MAVVFNEDLTLEEAWFIPRDVATSSGFWREQYRAWSVTLTSKLRSHSTVEVKSATQLRAEARKPLPS